MAERGWSLLDRLNATLEELGLSLRQNQEQTPTPTVDGSPQSPKPDKTTQNLEKSFDAFLDKLNKKMVGGGPSPQPLPQTQDEQHQQSWKDWLFPPQQTKKPKGGQPYGAPPPMDLFDGQTPVLELEKDVRKREWSKYGERKTQPLGDAAEMLGGMESKTGQKASSKLGEVAEVAQLGARAAAGDPTAMIALGDKAVKKVEERFEAGQQAVQSFGNAMTQDSAGKVAGSLFDAGQAGVKAVGLEGTPIDTMMQFGKAVAESVDRLRDMSREMINMNFRFSQFSASMASVEAEQEVRDYELGLGKGEARADSTAKLAEAMSELNEAFAPLENAWANFSNELMTQILKMITVLVRVEPFLKAIQYSLEMIVGKEHEDDKDTGINFGTFMIDESAKYGRPPRMPPG